MTERVNGKGSWIQSVYLAFLPTALTVIGVIAWWGFNKVIDAQDDIKNEIKEINEKVEFIESNQHEISIIQWHDPDTKERDKQTLNEIWNNTRSGKIYKTQ